MAKNDYLIKTAETTMDKINTYSVQKPNIFDDIGKLQKTKSGTLRNSEFKKFKKEYPDLYNGKLRNWNKQNVVNTLAQIRRTYNFTKKSPVQSYQISGKLLEESYKNLPTKTGGGGGSGGKTGPLHYVLTRRGKAIYRKVGTKTISTIINVPIDSLVARAELLNITYLSPNEINILHGHYTKYRVLVKVNFESGNAGWMSTPRLSIQNSSNGVVLQFLQGIQSKIMSKEDYYYGGIVDERIKTFEACEMYWM